METVPRSFKQFYFLLSLYNTNFNLIENCMNTLIVFQNGRHTQQ
jgi:hypothetical protein